MTAATVTGVNSAKELPYSEEHYCQLSLPVEASLKRWHTRLTRASNMVTKLEKQRRRLNGLPETRTLAEKFAEQRARAKPLEKVLAIETDHVAEVDLPAFLDRVQPADRRADDGGSQEGRGCSAQRHAADWPGCADLIKSKRKRPDDQPRPHRAGFFV